MKIETWILQSLFVFALFMGCQTTAQTASNVASNVASDPNSNAIPNAAMDTTAEKMLAYQTSIGGWTKAIGEQKVDYRKKLSEAQIRQLRLTITDRMATIDNDATTREIRYLVSTAYKNTRNPKYLEVAEKGIEYLLKMQYPNGGFPQFYPDSSSYRAQVTFNDNSIIHALTIFKYIVDGKNGFDQVKSDLKPKAQIGMERGIACILATQVMIDGKLTGWAQQYDHRTLTPAKARTFEPPGNTSMETVEIVEFLLGISNPNQAIKNAIEGAISWLEASKIVGKNVKIIDDITQPTKRDRVLYDDPNSVIWARYYDFETNQPFFCGRDGVKRASLSEIENERAAGYAWYGNWAEDLLSKKYPKWKEKN